MRHQLVLALGSDRHFRDRKPFAELEQSCLGEKVPLRGL